MSHIYDPNSVFLHLHRPNRIFYCAQNNFVGLLHIRQIYENRVRTKLHAYKLLKHVIIIICQ